MSTLTVKKTEKSNFLIQMERSSRKGSFRKKKRKQLPSPMIMHLFLKKSKNYSFYQPARLKL